MTRFRPWSDNLDMKSAIVNFDHPGFFNMNTWTGSKSNVSNLQKRKEKKKAQFAEYLYNQLNYHEGAIKKGAYCMFQVLTSSNSFLQVSPSFTVPLIHF